MPFRGKDPGYALRFEIIARAQPQVKVRTTLRKGTAASSQQGAKPSQKVAQKNNNLRTCYASELRSGAES